MRRPRSRRGFPGVRLADPLQFIAGLALDEEGELALGQRVHLQASLVREALHSEGLGVPHDEPGDQAGQPELLHGAGDLAASALGADGAPGQARGVRLRAVAVAEGVQHGGGALMAGDAGGDADGAVGDEGGRGAGR